VGRPAAPRAARAEPRAAPPVESPEESPERRCGWCRRWRCGWSRRWSAGGAATRYSFTLNLTGFDLAQHAAGGGRSVFLKIKQLDGGQVGDAGSAPVAAGGAGLTSITIANVLAPESATTPTTTSMSAQ